METAPIQKWLACIVASALSLPGQFIYAQESFRGDIPLYLEQAETAELRHRYEGPWEYFVGGGVATFDCNGDRFADVFIAGGINESSLYVNRSKIAGELKFVAQDSATTRIKQVTGAYPVNLNDDDWIDLAVLRVGENRLLKGGPDCSFTHANADFSYDGGTEWTTSFAANFNDNEKFPTLAFGNYVDRTAPGSPWGTCADNALYRPQVNGQQGGEHEVSFSESLRLSPGYCALSLLFTDWNRSGTDSLRITNDRQYYRGGEEQLWNVRGQYPRAYSRADGWQPVVIWGMGIAEGDLNADGFPEYALTSMGDTKLQSLDVQQAVAENRPVYEDIAFARGATAHRPYTGKDLKPSTGWHAEFADVNNDTLLDLYIAKGNVESMGDFAAYDPDNLLLGNHDQRFVEQGDVAGIALDRRGRGASVTDFNADGLLDLLVVNRDAPVSLFRHRGFKSQFGPRVGGNWLAIELQQSDGNRHAIGARLSIKTGNLVQTRTVRIGGGHASGKIGFVHVGLGVAERATVRVQWPDGEWSAAYRVFANQFVVLNRADDHVTYWYPAEDTSGQSSRDE